MFKLTKLILVIKFCFLSFLLCRDVMLLGRIIYLLCTVPSIFWCTRDYSCRIFFVCFTCFFLNGYCTICCKTYIHLFFLFYFPLYLLQSCGNQLKEGNFEKKEQKMLEREVKRNSVNEKCLLFSRMLFYRLNLPWWKLLFGLPFKIQGRTQNWYRSKLRFTIYRGSVTVGTVEPVKLCLSEKCKISWSLPDVPLYLNLNVLVSKMKTAIIC